MVNSELFTYKNKLDIDIRAFVQLYNQSNYKQVYEIYMIIEFKKIHILIIYNFHNLSVH